MKRNKIQKKAIVLLMTMMLIAAMTGCGKQEDIIVKVIDIPLTDEEYAFGVDKNNGELLAKANAYIATVKEDGTLDEICEKYFGDGTPEGVPLVPWDDSKDQLVVATNAEFSPFEYRSGDTFYGIDMELVAGFADYLGKELVILDVDFEQVINCVEDGVADMAVAGLTINETRMQSVDFTDPYYMASQVLIVPGTNTNFDDCETVEDVTQVLAGMSDGRIGGQSGTTAEYYVKGDADWEFEGIGNMSWVGYTSGSMAVNDMLTGNINFVILDEAPANMIVKRINASDGED